jgi:hypothetical protein
VYILAVGFTEAFACTLCNFGQKYVNDSRAALIMSFESVLAAFACYISIGENLTPSEIAGCAVILLSILLTIFEKVPSSLNSDEDEVSGVIVADTELALTKHFQVSGEPTLPNRRLLNSPSLVRIDDVSLKVLGESFYVVVNNK